MQNDETDLPSNANSEGSFAPITVLVDGLGTLLIQSRGVHLLVSVAVIVGIMTGMAVDMSITMVVSSSSVGSMFFEAAGFSHVGYNQDVLKKERKKGNLTTGKRDPADILR